MGDERPAQAGPDATVARYCRLGSSLLLKVAEGSVVLWRRIFLLHNGKCGECSSSSTQLHPPPSRQRVSSSLRSLALTAAGSLVLCSRAPSLGRRPPCLIRSRSTCGFLPLLTNPMNDLLPCSDGCGLIISITGLQSQQAEQRLTQGEAASLAPTAGTPVDPCRSIALHFN